MVQIYCATHFHFIQCSLWDVYSLFSFYRQEKTCRGLIASQGHAANEPGFQPQYSDPTGRAVNSSAVICSAPSCQVNLISQFERPLWWLLGKQKQKKSDLPEVSRHEMLPGYEAYTTPDHRVMGVNGPLGYRPPSARVSAQIATIPAFNQIQQLSAAL